MGNINSRLLKCRKPMFSYRLLLQSIFSQCVFCLPVGQGARNGCSSLTALVHGLCTEVYIWRVLLSWKAELHSTPFSQGYVSLDCIWATSSRLRRSDVSLHMEGKVIRSRKTPGKGNTEVKSGSGDTIFSRPHSSNVVDRLKSSTAHEFAAKCRTSIYDVLSILGIMKH